jgi:hypothetical protein
MTSNNKIAPERNVCICIYVLQTFRYFMTHIPEVSALVMIQYSRQERHYWDLNQDEQHSCFSRGSVHMHISASNFTLLYDPYSRSVCSSHDTIYIQDKKDTSGT